MVRRGARAMYDQFDKRGTTVIPLGENVGDAQGGRRDSPRGKRGWHSGKTAASIQQNNRPKPSQAMFYSNGETS